ncbi:MAG: metal-dependent transcriptional regulator [Gemmatimonadetes bacterium]|nr:metal-dependent transcriptional regulator [Gemmatimonadota bacterium]
MTLHYLPIMKDTGLSRSAEDYLKAVYSLNERGEAAGTNELARALEVQPGSVSGMIRRLAEDGLLEHEPYRGVRLTAEGSREALKILRRHRIIESFLVRRLGYDWEDVHAEAERLEHAASDRLIDRMAEAMGNPTTDPHGAPIPNREGKIDATPWPRLDEVAAGRRVTVRAVSDEDPERLRYFKSVSVVPGARAVVQRSGTDGGPVTLMVDGASEPLSMRPAVARRVAVAEM